MFMLRSQIWKFVDSVKTQNQNILRKNYFFYKEKYIIVINRKTVVFP